jgi:hypothetical protein
MNQAELARLIADTQLVRGKRGNAGGRPRARADKGPNRTEEDYRDRLELLRRSGEILKWDFQALTLRLAADTRYTPDFTVLIPQGPGCCRLEAHETKGHMEDDARAKVFIAASLFPWITFFVVRSRGRGRGLCRQWTFARVPRGELTPDARLRDLSLEWAGP